MNTIAFEYEDDNGDEQEGELPAKYEVCSRCSGEGSHVNPSIDGHGISAEEWDRDWDDESRDDESRETYMNGGYDVTCETCKGLRVELVIDEDAIERGSDELKKLFEHYNDVQESIAETYRIERSERAMGA